MSIKMRSVSKSRGCLDLDYLTEPLKKLEERK